MKDWSWLLDFIVRVKNLRGVLFFSGNDPDGALEGARWVGKRFRYRDIGVSAPLQSHSEESLQSRLQGKPFVPVQLPGVEMNQIMEQTRPEGFDQVLWEGLVTASVHACPLILVESLENAVPKDLWAFVARIGQPLDVNSAKFHLRVCDYAALDAFGPSTKELLRTAGEPSKGLVALLHERRERAMQDGEKRFWRLAENSGETAVIAILDPLGPAWASKPEAVIEALRKHGALAAALFSLVPAFVVVPGLTVEK